MKYKEILYNTLNLMTHCPNCRKKISDAYTKDDGDWHRIEKSCHNYKCATTLWITFKNESLYETLYIADQLKIEVNHVNKKTYLFRKELGYSTILTNYIVIGWIPIFELDEEMEIDLDHLNDLKLKMERMQTFS
jgi:hypothetical protein